MFVVKVKNHTIAIDSDDPEQHAEMKIEGEDPASIHSWVGKLYGMRGVGLDEWANCPIDLMSGIMDSKESYEILQGKEILDMPLEELPEGAVW
jgi:hypothetical protein